MNSEAIYVGENSLFTFISSLCINLLCFLYTETHELKYELNLQNAE